MGLFAALDRGGEVRFVGEVQGGAACACVCPTCGSAVLAKKGAINAWHFAHEPGQERPECEPGSLNLLRRLAIEGLMARPGFVFPPGSVRVTVDARLPELNQTVQMHYGLASVTQWHEAPARGARVATLALSDQTGVALFVEVGAVNPTLDPGESPGALLYACAAPPEGLIRTEQQALDFLQQYGAWHWLRLPDLGGRIERVRRELLARRAPLLAQWARVETLRSQQLSEDRLRGPAPPRHAFEPCGVPDPESKPELAAPPPEWVSWKKDRTSFYAFARPQEDAVWVVFDSALHDGYFIVPAPATFDGWDESLPASLGYVDLENGALVGPGPVSRVVEWFYRTPGVASRIDSDAAQILKFAQSK